MQVSEFGDIDMRADTQDFIRQAKEWLPKLYFNFPKRADNPLIVTVFGKVVWNGRQTEIRLRFFGRKNESGKQFIELRVTERRNRDVLYILRTKGGWYYDLVGNPPDKAVVAWEDKTMRELMAIREDIFVAWRLRGSTWTA